MARRDHYGRSSGNGRIKPYKSNLQGKILTNVMANQAKRAVDRI